MTLNKLASLFLFLLIFSCSSKDNGSGPISVSELPEEPKDTMPDIEEPTISDEELLDLTQKETFKYFWDFAETNSGSARERYHPGDASNDPNTVTTGGTGFGLMGILTGIERGFVTREQAIERLTKILEFFESADRFHGAWPHWLDGKTGKVKPFSPMDDGGDLVESAFLAQGLICIKEYFKDGTDIEMSLANKADQLWKGVEWDWYTQNKNVLYWHWSPIHNFNIDFELKGYNEVLIAYILAAASPDHTISKQVYTNGWTSNGGITSNNIKYGFPLLVKHQGNEAYGGPLFWAHYSYLALNPKNLIDDYADYWEVNVNQTKINYGYCVENPKGFKDYGTDCWGLTASYTRNNDGSFGYTAHSPSNDTGIISPTAAISSIPYTPEASLKALRYFYSHKDKLLGPAGFYDAFGPEYDFWVAEAYLAIDQGPQLIMIENYRTGLLWNIFMNNEDIRAGLDKLGFTYEN